MLLSSSAPLPNNTLTPIPQSAVDAGNARIGMLTLLANRAKSITDCYAPATSFLESSGPIVAAQVAAAQANASTATIASGTADGTPTAPASGDTPSSSPAPVVVPLNPVALGTPGGISIQAVSSCAPRHSIKSLPQPRMMMPKPAPAVVNVTPSPADTWSSYPSQVMRGLSGIAPAWGTYSMGSQGGGVRGLLDVLGPLALLVAAGWGLAQMTKGAR